MFVNILKFKLNEMDGISANELSMLEYQLQDKPNGLDRFHIFKDKKKENKYYLIEYWKNKMAKDAMENSSKFPFFNKIHQISNSKKGTNIECDILI